MFAKLQLGLIAVAVILLGLSRWQLSHTEAQLVAARSQLAAGAVLARTQAAIATDYLTRARVDSARADSLEQREATWKKLYQVTLAHIPPRPLTVADTCLPWQRRADSLEKALGLAEHVVATADTGKAVAREGAHLASVAADTAIHATTTAAATLEHVAATLPTKVPGLGVGVLLDVRAALAGGTGLAALQWGGLYAGYERSVPFRSTDPPASGRVVVGYHATVRLF